MFFKNYFQQKQEQRKFNKAKQDYLDLSKNYFDPEENNLLGKSDLTKIIKGEIKNNYKLKNPFDSTDNVYLLISHPILRHSEDKSLKMSSDNLSLFDNADWFGLISLKHESSFIIPKSIEFTTHPDYSGELQMHSIDEEIWGYGRGDYQLDKLWGTKIILSDLTSGDLVDTFKEVYSGTKYSEVLNKLKF